MTIRDRVTDVVEKWSTISDFKTSESLSALWAKSGQSASIPFQTQAVSQLITALANEFRAMFDFSGLVPNRFKPAGTVDTVDNLVDEVTFLPTVAADEAVLEGIARPGVQESLVKAIADEVERRLKPGPKKRKTTKKTAKKSSMKKITPKKKGAK